MGQAEVDVLQIVDAGTFYLYISLHEKSVKSML